MEDISDASFFGKLLVLPTNVRLDWKVIARNKHSCGLYYKQFTIVIYDRNAIGQYYKTMSTTIIVKASLS